MQSVLLLFLILISVTLVKATPGDEARLKDAHEQLKSLIYRNLDDPAVVERCKNEAKTMAGSDDPNMCIRRRYQECIFKASAMKAEYCEAVTSKRSVDNSAKQ